MNIQTQLEQVFGFKSLKPFQQQVIDSMLMDDDILVISPTGSGKSLCFQLPALLQEGMTIVLSPLRSLIYDQVEALKAKGVNCDLLNSDLKVKDRARVYGELSKKIPEIKLLYSTPESVICNDDTMGFIKTLHKNGLLARFVLDEAHCISTWGHDFRPNYLKVRNLKTEYPGVPIIALTATATNKVEADIKDILGLENHKLFKRSFLRENLNISIEDRDKNTIKTISCLLKNKYENQSAIIYAHSRKECEKISKNLKEMGISADFFHAGLTSKKRNKVQNGWIENEIQVIVATIAFGMGIDKADVRVVFHYNLPKSIEGYYQEIGRAGRDGEPADCILYYSYQDKIVYEKMHLCEMKNNSKNAFYKQKKIDNIKYQIEKLYDMIGFIENNRDCRHILLCNYFCEKRKEKLGFCENRCDSCRNMRSLEITDYSELCKSIIETIMTKKDVNKTKVKKILMGSKTEKESSDYKDYGKFRREKGVNIDRVMIHLIIKKYIKENLIKTHNGFWMEKLELYKKSQKILNGEKAIKI